MLLCFETDGGHSSYVQKAQQREIAYNDEGHSFSRGLAIGGAVDGVIHPSSTDPDSILSSIMDKHMPHGLEKGISHHMPATPSHHPRDTYTALGGQQQSLLKTVDNKDIYFSISNISKTDKTAVKTVLDLLFKRKTSDTDPYVPQPIKGIVTVMINFLEFMFHRIDKFLGKDPEWWGPPDGFGRPPRPGRPPIN
ncbi:hypothetical protein ANO11243_097510 [Dothideomycetidae sp. 11243]|nr:hypothetical protein ANO11243_097510 [fungal sp. No.11243]